MDVSNDVIKTVVSLVLSGGAGLVTTIASRKSLQSVVDSLQDELKRVASIVGSEQPHMTGFFARLSSLEQALGQVRKDLQHFEDNPPTWVARMARTRTSSFSLEAEERFLDLAGQIAKLSSKVKGLEDNSGRNESYVTEKEFEAYSRVKTQELAKIQAELANLSGTLKGILAGLGVKPAQR